MPDKSYVCGLCGHTTTNVRNTVYLPGKKLRVCANANQCRDRRNSK
jgi:ribosome-binding protein aMBF1 (putative translation factor)